jgi:hypothetical protein
VLVVHGARRGQEAKDVNGGTPLYCTAGNGHVEAIN